MGLTPEPKNLATNDQPERDPSQQLDATAPSISIGLEEFLSSPTPLTDEVIDRVISVVRDHLKYGGNFYTHLTGKDPQLEKNVDYNLRYDRSSVGEIDMDSYRQARQKKVDDWLAKEENQVWLRGASEFHQKYESEISYGHEAVVFKSTDGSTGTKSRFTTNLFYSDGWLYYESNNFHKENQCFVQPEREAHKYRIYFSLGGGEVISTFREVIDLLKSSEEIRRFGFQTKTVDLYRTDHVELSKVINQKDRMVLYLGENSLRAAFPLLQKYAEENRDKFSLPGILFAKPIIDSTGRAITGISMTSSAKGVSPDPTSMPREYHSFNDMQSSIVESSLRSIVTALKKPSLMLAMTNPFPGIQWDMERISPQASTNTFLRTILNHGDGPAFLAKYFKQAYPQWANLYGLRENNTAFKVD